MIVYRIARREYINDITDTGAKLYGGRWNEKGTPALYCSENVSLAILEILVHFDGLTVPLHLSLLTIEIPDNDITVLSKATYAKLTKGGDSEAKFKKEGMKWIQSKDSLALKVPSLITQYESNVIINTRHSNFNKIKKHHIEDLALDERLFKV